MHGRGCHGSGVPHRSVRRSIVGAGHLYRDDSTRRRDKRNHTIVDQGNPLPGTLVGSYQVRTSDVGWKEPSTRYRPRFGIVAPQHNALPRFGGLERGEDQSITFERHANLGELVRRSGKIANEGRLWREECVFPETLQGVNLGRFVLAERRQRKLQFVPAGLLRLRRELSRNSSPSASPRVPGASATNSARAHRPIAAR